MKLTPGVNFTKVLQAAFRQEDPKSTCKKTLAALLGSLFVKAARKIVVKSTTGEC